ncbi:MAG: hypothetical protein CM1200mP10_24670 [Candidatus Neomarinimicrobiota bacterium]|nr:MAG: hypothetical protein CM1200mP10_24670 [Candidatus Neomarinimicrobiota bacterium]
MFGSLQLRTPTKIISQWGTHYLKLIQFQQRTQGWCMYDLGSAMSFLGAIPILGKVGEQAKVFGNFGNVQKVPILDNVIDDGDGTIASDPSNEVFVSFEVGLNLRSDDGTMAGKINYYNTSWNDRNLVKSVTTGQGSSGDTDLIYLTGVNQKHSGIEVEGQAS